METNRHCISDSEDFQPVAPAVKVEPLKNQWADEDVEEDDVKESWEEEEEEEEVTENI
jgi:translation initiation factor 3 subunit J